MSALLVFVVIGFVVLGLFVYRIHGRTSFRKHFSAYCFASALGGLLSFGFLVFAMRAAPILFERYWVGVDAILSRITPPASMNDARLLMIVGLLISSIYVGMLLGAFVTWRLTKAKRE